MKAPTTGSPDEFRTLEGSAVLKQLRAAARRGRKRANKARYTRQFNRRKEK